jgi:hypothetical protein
MSRSRLGWLLLLAAVLIAGLILWSKVRIVILVPLHIGGLVLLGAGLALVIYLVLRLLFRR